MSDATATVSVVIPCYNGARFLGEALESVRAQTYAASRILVVDDGSSDDSPEIASRFPGVDVIRQANQGVSAARNRGFAACTSSLVVFHDADDRLLPTALEIGVRALAQHPECGLVYGFARELLADGTVNPPPVRPRVSDAGYPRMLGGEAIVPPSVAMLRCEAVREAGGFTPIMAPAEDYEFFLRVTRRFAIHCHNELVVEYRQHEGNASLQSGTRTFRAALRALAAQEEFVRGKPELEQALLRGRAHWARVFGPTLAYELARLVRRGDLSAATATLGLLLRHRPQALVEVARQRVARGLRRAS